MDESLWRRVQDFLDAALLPEDPALEEAVAAGVAAGMPQIQVTAAQGKLLYLLATAVGARRVLEVGTLAGYSAIWLGRAVAPQGSVVTLEASAKHAAVARENVERAGLAGVIEVREGLAIDLLAQLRAHGEGPFDFVFIDADREHDAEYVVAALELARPGTLIAVDNVVRAGRILDGSGDPGIAGLRRMLDLISREPRLEATAIQTVSPKGYDGFALIRVK
jgi:predicted O-methyltransferase YrrM